MYAKGFIVFFKRIMSFFKEFRSSSKNVDLQITKDAYVRS